MHLTSIKQENSTEISSLKLNLYSKKLELTRHCSATLKTNKINVTILSTFVYDKRISAVYNLFSTIIQFFLPLWNWKQLNICRLTVNGRWKSWLDNGLWKSGVRNKLTISENQFQRLAQRNDRLCSAKQISFIVFSQISRQVGNVSPQIW